MPFPNNKKKSPGKPKSPYPPNARDTTSPATDAATAAATATSAATILKKKTRVSMSPFATLDTIEETPPPLSHDGMQLTHAMAILDAEAHELDEDDISIYVESGSDTRLDYDTFKTPEDEEDDYQDMYDDSTIADESLADLLSHTTDVGSVPKTARGLFSMGKRASKNFCTYHYPSKPHAN